MSSLFPVFLKLQGRECLVVGAGRIAEQKIGGLLASGAQVRVVAPEGTDSIRELADSGAVTWARRAFEPNDLAGVAVVVAATENVDINRQVFEQAERRGVLCNAVDEPEHCHFYYPAVVRRGDLQIAISTGGHSPALAQRLRAELEAQFGYEYSDWLRWLGKMRRRLFKGTADPEKRKSALHRLASRESFEHFSASQRGKGVR